MMVTSTKWWGAWWPSGSTLAFRSEGRGFGPAGRHAISAAWGPRRCSVPGVAWLAEFVGGVDPQESERGIGVVGHASSFKLHSCLCGILRSQDSGKGFVGAEFSALSHFFFECEVDGDDR